MSLHPFKCRKLEFLRAPARRYVRMAHGADQPESWAEQGCEAGGIVARHREAAAFFRTIGREGADDGKAAAPQGLAERPHIGPLVFGLVEKMQRCAIMPEIIKLCWRKARNVALDPFHGASLCAQPRVRDAQRRTGEVKHAGRKALRQQMIDQPRRTAANVNDVGRGLYAGCADQRQRQFGRGLIPAHAGIGLLLIDPLPMIAVGTCHRSASDPGLPERSLWCLTLIHLLQQKGHLMATSNITPIEQRHRDKMAKRKAVQDAEVASKSVHEKGLLIVHTGPGKGKSTAAFGLMLRALGHGWKVGVVQFIKGEWETGEKRALARFGDLVSWHTMGEGFTWETQDRARDTAAAERAFAKALDLMADDGIRLLVLDELNIALRYDYLPLDGVLTALRGRRADLHVVVTGRNAKPELIELADLVTEMSLIKHHFAAGVRAQEGIEF